MKLNTDEAKKIKKQLPHGAIKEISEITGMSYRATWDILSGKYSNTKVIKAALKYLIEYRQKEEEMKETLRRL